MFSFLLQNELLTCNLNLNLNTFKNIIEIIIVLFLNFVFKYGHNI